MVSAYGIMLRKVLPTPLYSSFMETHIPELDFVQICALYFLQI